MARHFFHDVAIVGVHNTEQARVLEGHDSRSITFAAGLGALADAGLAVHDVDGVMGQGGNDFLYQARIGPVWRSASGFGLPGILDAAAAIAAGQATTVLLSGIRRCVHRACVDGAVDASGERVRRAVRDVHRGRVRAHGPPPHAPVRDDSRRRWRRSRRRSATTAT